MAHNINNPQGIQGAKASKFAGHHKDLDNMEKMLLDQREQSVSSQNVEQIQRIDEALAQIDSARGKMLEKEQMQKVSDSQTRLGQVKTVKEAIKTEQQAPIPNSVSPQEAEQIRKIRQIQSYKLPKGHKFRSFNGREPSVYSHYKRNRDALFELQALREKSSFAKS